ncbi:MAG: GntR family transcriptional regulator [Clostridia bacterium]|nr:GntR family transcriptional regulator [Clostridia bacterium]
MDALELMPVRVRITSILKKAIYTGEYHSGDELSLSDVAAQLGVSRTPVREAFQALEAEGLITLRMNRGAIVNQIDRKFIADIFDMRMLLESEAAARAAANGMETAALLERLHDLRDHLEALDRADYEALNQDIHMAIWTAADNHKLKAYLMEMWNGPSTGLSADEALAHYRDSTFEHIDILRFIRDGKPEAAREAMARHIARSRENILKRYPTAE